MALQPLGAFLERASAANPDNREARALSAQREADVDTSTGRLFPSLSLSGAYTRNQYDVTIALPTPSGGAGSLLTIQPTNQFDASAVLNVPLIDVGAWDRVAAARALSDATVWSGRVTALDIEKRTTRAYFQLLADEALLGAARQRLEVNRKNAEVVRDRRASGTASELDVQRAVASVARAEQDLTSAELGAMNAGRDLASLSRLEPEPVASFPEDSLVEEAPLTVWLGGLEARLPSIAYAAASRVFADKSAEAARSAYLPTLGASATERFTNATGFVGHSSYYTLQATLSWRFDATLAPSVRAQDAAAAAARASEDRALRAAEDDVVKAWREVHAGIQKVRAARAQLAATALAADLARERYQNGVATQLDVLQAQQEAFSASVSRIQADTDLGYARAALRLSAGRKAALEASR